MYTLITILNFAYLFLLGYASPIQHNLFVYSNNANTQRINTFQILEDPSETLKIDNVANAKFGPSVNRISNSKIVNWVKFDIKNNTQDTIILITLKNPSLENVDFYQFNSAKNTISNAVHLSRELPFNNRSFKSVNYIYKVILEHGESSTIFIRIKSSTPSHIPLYIGKPLTVIEENLSTSVLVGIYIGIICIMFFYNLFVYFTVDDRSYLYYIFYILAVGLAQLVLNGYAFKYLWPNNFWLSINAYNLSGIVSGIATALFVQSFLNTKRIAPKLHIVFNAMIFLYLIALAATLFISRIIAFNIINVVAGVGSLFALFTGYYIAKQGFRAAYFFLLAFSIFLVSVIVHILVTADMLPYSTLSQNSIEIGSSIQILLLSFALADKINTYRKEQALAKQEALAAAQENERLVKEQNIILEEQVHKRTLELKDTNDNLSNTLSQLKYAQSKLVESEKMVSLGQLTAGIAHEINNPINFVTSNVKPLELDINDLQSVIKKYEEIDLQSNIADQLSKIELYKKQIDTNYLNEEIKTLLTGIREGAHRTAEIVSNLKNFARIDEANVKYVNLNQGIESTLMLVKNSFPKDFTITKELGSIPNVECMPGKINQVFMNIITNGLQSIEERQAINPGPGTLVIKTYNDDEHVKISIKDNGIGIKEEVKDKLFDPFYTTKPVGQGTGLGMSIVKGIMDTHKGSIEINSIFGEGAEFIITLPVNYLN